MGAPNVHGGDVVTRRGKVGRVDRPGRQLQDAVNVKYNGMTGILRYKVIQVIIDLWL